MNEFLKPKELDNFLKTVIDNYAPNQLYYIIDLALMFPEKSEAEIGLIIDYIEKAKGESVIHTYEGNFALGPFAKAFLNDYGGFVEWSKKERRKKLYEETKQLSPIGISLIALGVAACSWLFPRTDNEQIRKLQSQITLLKSEDKVIKDSLSSLRKSKTVYIQTLGKRDVFGALRPPH